MKKTENTCENGAELRNLAIEICIEANVLERCENHSQVLLSTGEELKAVINHVLTMVHKADERLRGKNLSEIRREIVAVFSNNQRDNCPYRNCTYA